MMSFGSRVGSQCNVTGVLIKRGNVDIDVDKEWYSEMEAQISRPRNGGEHQQSPEARRQTWDRFSPQPSEKPDLAY